MSKTKDTTTEVDPVQAKYEAEALAEQAKLDKAAKAKGEAYSEPAADAVEPYEGMPQRFLTGGATAAEKEAWVAENGGVDPTQPVGEVAPGDAAPKAEGDVAPE
jgi:hypothetical protein